MARLSVVTRSLRLVIALLALLALAPSAQAKKAKPKPPPLSPFTWRGIIEGYYGTAAKPAPWTHGERTRMINWMGTHGFNAYVHAPKADPYQTTQWRDPYSPVLQRNFTKEIRLAESLGVHWIPSLSPARGPVDSPSRLCFSCSTDMDAMLAKLQPFLAAGAKTVMVSFDDIERQLGPTDAAVYGARFPGAPAEYLFARATADFLNVLLTRLPPGTGLLTVLPDYAGTTDTPFLQGIREGALNPAIGVMWTGPTIRASDFTADQARSYAQLIGRTPIVWENWVARDFVPSRLFLGPFKNDHDVGNAVQGFFFNPMNEADLNMLPLATAGAWLQDPERYDARRAWRAAITELSRGRQPQLGALRAFAETSYSSGLLRKEAPTATRAQNAFLSLYGRGARWTDAASALRDELRLVMSAPKLLKSLHNRRFATEAAPFLSAARRAARAGLDATDLLVAERPALELEKTKDGLAGVATPPDPDAVDALRARLQANTGSFRANIAGTSPLYVFGCAVRTRGCGAHQFNRLDDYLNKAAAADAAWAPTAHVAAARVRVTLDGKKVRRHRDGSFTLPAESCGGRLLAVDGAGGETSLALPACPRKKKHPGAGGDAGGVTASAAP